MASQDCPNCHYPAPNRKKPGEGERVPQGMYHAPDRSGEPEECPQCFYQPEAVEERPEEECPQCFYQRGRAEAGGGQGGRLLSVLL